MIQNQIFPYQSALSKANVKKIKKEYKMDLLPVDLLGMDLLLITRFCP